MAIAAVHVQQILCCPVPAIGIAAQQKEIPWLGLVWERFPKFLLDFIAAALLFSFMMPAAGLPAFWKAYFPCTQHPA